MSVSLKNTKTALATMFLAAGMAACGGKGDDPQPNPPQTGGKKVTHTLKLATVGLKPGHPGDPSVGVQPIPSEITSLTLQTNDGKIFRAEVGGSDKVVLSDGTFERQYNPNLAEQNEYITNAKSIYFIKNAGTAQADTTEFLTQYAIFKSGSSPSTFNEAMHGMNTRKYNFNN